MATSATRDALIEAHYSDGQSLRQVARLFEISHERVRQVLEARGVTLRTKGEGVRARKAQRAA